MMANIGGPENMAVMGTTRPSGYNINKQTWKKNMQSKTPVMESFIRYFIYSAETLNFGEGFCTIFEDEWDYVFDFWSI